MKCAIRRGNLEIVSMLINDDLIRRDGYTVLHVAIKHRQSEIANLLMSKGASVFPNRRRKPWNTLLHFAVINYDIEMVKKLIDRGVKLNAKNQRGLTALHYAAEGFETTDIVELLLDSQANVDPRDKYGRTPLRLAIENGNIDVVRKLLDHEADVNAKDCFDVTMLHIAAAGGYTDIVKLILTKNAQINVTDDRDRTPLFVAIKNKRVDTAMDIIETGASTFTYQGRFTVLHTAIDCGLTQVVESLLRTASTVTESHTYPTMLHIAICRGHINIVRILLKYGANIDFKSTNGMAPIHCTVYYEMEEICKLLIKIGADVHARSKNNETTLHLAAKKGNVQIMGILLDSGVDINAVDNYGQTALHLAAKKGNVQIMGILLDSGVDINAVDNYGQTALHLATNERREDAVLFLIGNDSDLNIVNQDGYRPSHLARCYPTEHIDSNNDVDNAPHPELTIIQQSLIKMEVVTLKDVDKKKLENIRNIRNGSFQFMKKCEKEIKRMKRAEIHNTTLTFYNILTEHIDRIASYTKNKVVVQALKANHYETEFREYAGIIKLRFDRGMVRNELLDNGRLFFRYYFPSNCIEIILSHLTNKDLRTLGEINYNSDINYVME